MTPWANVFFPIAWNLLKFLLYSKKKDALIKTNYRPVSILVALSKIYEKALGVQLTDYFNAILSTLLSAFRKGYSCQSALLNMIEKFKSSLDKGEFVACLSMAISKAFDCLPHCLTICKLFAYGLSREACTLIASYLFQRKQRVKIGNIKSEWGEINKGVPQGSILGPLIFNIFLNDLFYFVKEGNMYNYADDNSISVSHKELTNLSRQLQTEAEVTVQCYPNGPEAGREAGWGSEFVPLKKRQAGSFILLHKISRTACCFGIRTFLIQYSCYESATNWYTDHQYLAQYSDIINNLQEIPLIFCN